MFKWNFIASNVNVDGDIKPDIYTLLLHRMLAWHWTTFDIKNLTEVFMCMYSIVTIIYDKGDGCIRSFSLSWKFRLISYEKSNLG